MNQMDITIYVKWSCNLEHPEHPEQKILKLKAEQKIENLGITFKNFALHSIKGVIYE